MELHGPISLNALFAAAWTLDPRQNFSRLARKLGIEPRELRLARVKWAGMVPEEYLPAAEKILVAAAKKTNGATNGADVVLEVPIRKPRRSKVIRVPQEPSDAAEPVAEQQADQAPEAPAAGQDSADEPPPEAEGLWDMAPDGEQQQQAPDDEWSAAGAKAGAGNPYLGLMRLEIFAAADALDHKQKHHNNEAVKHLIGAAIIAKFDDVDISSLCTVLASKSGATKTSVTKTWAKMAEAQATAARREPTPEEQAGARAEQRRELTVLAEPIINEIDPIGRFLRVCVQLGVVNEITNIKAVLLSANSRVLAARRVLSVMNVGVSAAGKSHVTGQVMTLMPSDVCIRLTRGSALSLVYACQEDPNALRHRVIWLEEAAGAVAGSDNEDNVFTAVLRPFLTDGRIDNLVTISNGKGGFTSQKMVAEGPVALITSSARDVFDPEMMTRIVTMSTDESHQQTSEIINFVLLEGEDVQDRAPEIEAEIAAWHAFQRLLQLDAPYRVTIPFRRAIRAALGTVPKAVRFRRDFPAFLLAIRASAITHIHQRQRDPAGRIVAQIEDYRIAYETFDVSLTTLYGHQVSPQVIDVVAAIEVLIAADRAKRVADEQAKGAGAFFNDNHLHSEAPRAILSYDQIMKQMNMASRKTLTARLRAAKAAEVIEIVSNRSGFSNRSPSYEVLTPSAELRTQHHHGLLPSPEEVQAMIANPVGTEKRIQELRNEKLDGWSDTEGEDEVIDEAEAGDDLAS